MVRIEFAIGSVYKADLKKTEIFSFQWQVSVLLMTWGHVYDSILSKVNRPPPLGCLPLDQTKKQEDLLLPLGFSPETTQQGGGQRDSGDCPWARLPAQAPLESNAPSRRNINNQNNVNLPAIVQHRPSRRSLTVFFHSQ